MGASFPTLGSVQVGSTVPTSLLVSLRVREPRTDLPSSSRARGEPEFTLLVTNPNGKQWITGFRAFARVFADSPPRQIRQYLAIAGTSEFRNPPPAHGSNRAGSRFTRRLHVNTPHGQQGHQDRSLRISSEDGLVFMKLLVKFASRSRLQKGLTTARRLSGYWYWRARMCRFRSQNPGSHDEMWPSVSPRPNSQIGSLA